MKKFIVTFDHKGFSFNAKVFIRKQGNAIIYSIEIVEDYLSFMFENQELVFSKEQDGYKMMLFSGCTRNTKQAVTMLNWHIKNEYIDKVNSLHKNTFSMS